MPHFLAKCPLLPEQFVFWQYWIVTFCCLLLYRWVSNFNRAACPVLIFALKFSCVKENFFPQEIQIAVVLLMVYRTLVWGMRKTNQSSSNFLMIRQRLQFSLQAHERCYRYYSQEMKGDFLLEWQISFVVPKIYSFFCRPHILFYQRWK